MKDGKRRPAGGEPDWGQAERSPEWRGRGGVCHREFLPLKNDEPS